jgi:hypothetical protein
MDLMPRTVEVGFMTVPPRYHVVVEQPHPNNSWRWGWEIYRDGQPLPVRLRRGPYSSKQGAERAGAKALREFLAGLAREQYI